MNSAPTGQAWLPWITSIVGACFAFAALAKLGPSFMAPPVAAYVFAFACTSVATLLTSWHVPVTSARSLWLPVPALVALGCAHTLGAESRLASALVLAGLLAGGTVLGSAIGARVQVAGHMIFVAIVSSAVDVFSVFSSMGPTAALLEAPAAISLLVLPWPMVGTSDIAPILGVGDVVFAALYRSAARAHGLGSPRTLLALSLALAATLLALLWVQQPIPALPFLGLAYVLAHPEARRVPDAEKKQGWIVVAGLLLVLSALARYRP